MMHITYFVYYTLISIASLNYKRNNLTISRRKMCDGGEYTIIVMSIQYLYISAFTLGEVTPNLHSGAFHTRMVYTI